MHNSFNISVVIPNYNRSQLLIKAINSALNQTFPIHEILVCDDGSSDDSKTLVSNLNHPKVKWVDCGKNGRPAIPRNIGIKQSTGNWIAFLDNDDEWLPDKIEEQVLQLNKSNNLISCTNAYRVKKNNFTEIFSNFSKNEIELFDLMKQNEVICSSVLVQKKLLLTTSLFPEEKQFKAIEDYALWVRLCTNNKIDFITNVLLNYYDNSEDSIRKDNNIDGWDTLNVIFSDYKNWVTNKHLSAENKNALKKLFKKIKRKGVPTAYEEFIRKFKSKLNIN